MAPYIVGFVVNGNNEAFHEALAIKQICHRAGIDFVIRRIPKGSRWSADLYIKAAKEDVGVHGFIFFGHLVRTHLDHAKADTLPSASRPLKYLHDYLHLIWRNMRFADDVAEASRRQHTSTSRPRHLAFVGDAENTQRLGLLQETWPNRLRNCKVCLLNPSNFAGCLLASRLVGDGAEVFCINDNAVDIARKEQGGTLHSASLNEQKLADVMAGCHFIVRDDLHTETERLQQLPNGSAQIVLPSWDALDRAVEQDLNLQLRTEKALDMSILMTNLRRVFPTQQAFSGPRPGGTHTLNQHTTNALAEFVQSHRYFPRNARRKRSRRQSDACPQLPNQPRPTIKVDKARRQKQHRSLQKEQRAMTAKFKSLNLSDEEDFPILQGQTVAEHSQAPRLGVTVLKDWTKYAAYNFSRRDSEDSIMTEE